MSKIMCRASRRWCPTPEQVIILQELYRGGLRTPKAPLIQKITAHLSLYGKIQGKNVFYWFQNHKARDRQKLRKIILSKQLLFEQQEKMNYIQTNHLVYTQLHSNNNRPYPSGYHHHHPQHGSSTFIYQGMSEDASRGGWNEWKMDDNLLKSYDEAQNGYLMDTSSCGHDYVMIEGPASAIPSCNSSTNNNNNNNNNRNLQTLDLFPTTPELTYFKDQISPRDRCDMYFTSHNK